MSRFIVLTVDHDEQQTFVDVTEAASRDAALQTVLDCREYCCHGAAYTPAELRELANRSETCPVDCFEEVL